jgi:hypothetical protein
MKFMKIVTNPHTADIHIIYGPHGHGQKYTIAAGKSVSFSDEETPIADYFKEIYDFLQVEEKLSPLVDNSNPLACQYCGYIAKSKLGRVSHERFCKEKKEKVIIEITPEKQVRVVSRIQDEIANFGNTDKLSAGKKEVEVIGNRKQEIVYDRDGVGWYGPGLESDMAPTKNRPGRF